jgi:phosphoglycolate phosphatase
MKAIKFALRNFDIEIEDENFLKRYIGAPLVDCFMEFNGFSLEQAETALKHYRDYYLTVGRFENALFDGIADMLKTLNEKGVKCVIATSKPTDFMGNDIEYLGLNKYLYKAFGASFDDTRRKKKDIIKYGLEKLNANPLECVMVGDHHNDIIGANENNVKSIAVTYGYGVKRELLRYNPTYMVDSVNELKNILLTLI